MQVPTTEAVKASKTTQTVSTKLKYVKLSKTNCYMFLPIDIRPLHSEFLDIKYGKYIFLHPKSVKKELIKGINILLILILSSNA